MLPKNFVNISIIPIFFLFTSYRNNKARSDVMNAMISLIRMCTLNLEDKSFGKFLGLFLNERKFPEEIHTKNVWEFLKKKTTVLPRYSDRNWVKLN